MDIFQVLSDPHRRRLISLLKQDGSMSLKALSEGTDISRQAVTKHLNKLIQVKLVYAEFQGRVKVHTLNDQALLPVYQWLSPFARQWQHRLDNLDEFLNQENPNE
ncbi:ArsR/SmtB family transcription factor [Alteromonas aestuariivivens]|nr:helix-turn-helix domain-containing protein [Alteromonas aestuariivivens]